MLPGENISYWIERLKTGDEAAAQRLWEEYFRRLVGLARSRLAGVNRGIADEEDVALSAFASLCRGAELQRFPRLNDRTDLWKLIVVITARKASTFVAREARKKRGGRRAATRPQRPSDCRSIAEIVCPEPTPAFAAELAEEYRRLLDALTDPELRLVAVRKVEGFSNQEIAESLGRSLATIERKLKLIRKTWEAVRPAD